jgi:signal transduction histidine kinase
LIDDTAEVLSSKFIDHKIRAIKAFYADQGLQVLVDPNQLRQALLNIFLNAIEAMPHGGELRIETKQSVHHFEIMIGDTGRGIPKEDLPQIFDPFFSRKDHGTGLGLAITQSLIENHKGTIEVRSVVGSGTEVRIRLPLAHIIPE